MLCMGVCWLCGKKPFAYIHSAKKTYFCGKHWRMIKIPYGRSDFKSLILNGYHYVDRTGYLRRLEASGGTYLFFLRPRRFGKSLWISMLQHYYGAEHKADFGALFGKTDIGQNPTPLANTFLVLRLDFSQIETSTEGSTVAGFRNNVLNGVRDFQATYPYALTKEQMSEMEKQELPAAIIQNFFVSVRNNVPDAKIYLLIDEYDHFANELVAFDLERFKASVTGNGWVRKFYEAIKNATGQGTVERMFITGVSPLTLDSLTSGFNIGTQLSTDVGAHDMMGFAEAEVRTILEGVGVKEADVDKVLADVRAWYNGYLFNDEASNRLYNPDMVLYFAEEYRKAQKYPKKMLDTNIASDYGKIKGMFGVGDQETNDAVLFALLEGQLVSAELTAQFSFERAFFRADFISLLFYMGLLTVDSANDPIWHFRPPNYVIRELYFRYFLEMTLDRANIVRQRVDLAGMTLALAQRNDPGPLFEMTSQILKGLSDRDAMGFDEKHLKMVVASLLFSVQQFYIRSEHEVPEGYIDLLLLRHPSNKPHHQFALELKYLKKNEAKQLKQKAAEACAQLERYREDPYLNGLQDFHAWAVVFVGDEVGWSGEVR